MYDVLIIGGGPAGLACAVYTGRGGLSTLVLEQTFLGGQVTTTYEVDNYPGIPETISGVDLATRFGEHAARFGAEIKYETITGLTLDGEIKTVTTTGGIYTARYVVLAMGATPRELGLPREAALRGAGVSYCATCDGAFYRGKDVCVVGGGDTALEDAVYLSRFCHSVHLIHRRDQFRAHQGLVRQVRAAENITIHYDSVAEEIVGEPTVQGIQIRNVKTDETTVLDASGLFIAVGTKPSTELVADQVPLTEDGYIVTNDRMETAVSGVYAAGDLRKKQLRQIITAAADGAVAGYNITTRA